MTELGGHLAPNVATRLLIVDDEAQIRASLTRALSLMGFAVEAAASGEEALERLERALYDVMVLDIHMPGMGGVEVMQRAHQIRPQLLIVVLTGHATLESAIAAVKSEAVDYLLKPASVYDIASAVTKALRKRDEQIRRKRLIRVMGEALDALRQADELPAPASPQESPEPRLLNAAPLTLDCQRRLVVVDNEPGRTVELTAGEAAILAALMAHPDRVLSCGDLVGMAFGYDADEREAASVVRPYVCRLRGKIETIFAKTSLIRTIRGRGYLFASALE